MGDLAVAEALPTCGVTQQIPRANTVNGIGELVLPQRAWAEHLVVTDHWVSPQSTAARLWDFDVTIVNLEKWYRAVYQSVTNQLFGNDNLLRNSALWREVFQPAFGKPTHQTHETIVSIAKWILEGSEQGRQRWDAYLKRFAPLLESGMTHAQIVGEVRNTTAQFFLDCCHREDYFYFDAGRAQPRLQFRYSEATMSNNIIAAKNSQVGSHIPLDEMKAHRRYERGLFDNMVITPLPGVLDLIARSYRAGHVQGIVTSSRSNVITPFLYKLGIIDYFAVVIGSEMVQNTKPHPEPYLSGLQELNALGFDITADQCEVHEDSPGGACSGLRAGMRVIVHTQGTRAGRLIGRLVENLASDLNAGRIPEKAQLVILHEQNGWSNVRLADAVI